jgi:hypothetical protein
MLKPLGIFLVGSRNEKEAMPKLTVTMLATSATETTYMSALSINRGSSVRARLRAECGVPGERLTLL